MKRIILLFLLTFIVGTCIGCRLDVYINEEIEPIRDNNGNTIGENVIITIPDGYNDKYINLSPLIIDGFKHYRGNDDFIVKLTINNNSKYNYSYVDDSFIINTDIPYDSNNYEKIGIGFDGLDIYDSFYRTYNDALVSLVGNLKLDDNTINTYLINKGYKGISELDRYYIDYYGLNYMDYIFDGDVSNYKESNNTLIRKGYKYFYTNIININDRGVYNYLGKSYFNSSFNNKENVNLFYIDYIDNKAFYSYLYNIKFNFKLKKEHSKNFWVFFWKEGLKIKRNNVYLNRVKIGECVHYDY